ncbi:YheC/YheD family protein, partial [Bacillus altitudinis]
MKRKRYIIAPHSASEKTVHLPAQFKEQGAILSIALGSCLVDDFTISYHHQSQRILLSEDLYRALLIPYKTKADVILVQHT